MAKMTDSKKLSITIPSDLHAELQRVRKERGHKLNISKACAEGIRNAILRAKLPSNAQFGEVYAEMDEKYKAYIAKVGEATISRTLMSFFCSTPFDVLVAIFENHGGNPPIELVPDDYTRRVVAGHGKQKWNEMKKKLEWSIQL